VAKSGFDIRKLKAFARQFQAGGNAPPELYAVYKQWGIRYLAFIKKRFLLNSSGGGSWPPLKPATILARRHKGKKRRALRTALKNKRQQYGIE